RFVSLDAHRGREAIPIFTNILPRSPLIVARREFQTQLVVLLGFASIERSDFGDAVAIGFDGRQRSLRIALLSLCFIVIFIIEDLTDRHLALRWRAVGVEGRNIKLKR